MGFSYNAFISYRRSDGSYIARAIRDGIERANPGLSIFIDLDELSSGNFNEALLRVIANTPNFILIITRDTFSRFSNENDWVRKELTEAVRQKRNIIPVFVEGAGFPPVDQLPEPFVSLPEFNGIEYSAQYHQEAIRKLVSFFRHDTVESDEQRDQRTKSYFERYMVNIPSGRFLMGSEIGKADERPVREVEVSSFWMMKYQVTQKEYQDLMNVNPGNFKHDHKPVQNVSWFDAITFCNKWSERDGLEEVYELDNFGGVRIHFDRVGYRLPTEAEWEYACRAGTTTEFFWGDSEADWDKYAWHDRNSDDQVHVVGQRNPNPWGLYDMTGNVWEWCSDWYDVDYYSFGEQINPRGPKREYGESRVMRGGAWAYDPVRLRSAARLKRDPSLTDDVSGFRCVINRHPLEK